jgi:hypothetical protein
VSNPAGLARREDGAYVARQQPEEGPMTVQKYLCLYRSAPSAAEPPSPAQMQEMFAAFNAWKDKFKGDIHDLGTKLRPTGKVVTASGVTDGPYVEAKEIIAGYMILAAESYEKAVAVVNEMPGMQMPGACVEIREMVSF